MARRAKLLLGSSLLHSFDDSLWFWTYLFATCCYTMRTKSIKNMLEKLTKMVPKWSQNLSKIDPGGGLEASWEPPLKQDASKTSLLTILAPFWDPLWDQFGVILGIIFKMIFEMAFWWPWPPFGLPKDLQNETQKGVQIKTLNSLILLVFTTLEPHLRVLKIVIFWYFFGTPFCDAFWSPFWWFWLTFGVTFGNHFGHLLGYHFGIDF